jgi:hypothetical protein
MIAAAFALFARAALWVSDAWEHANARIDAEMGW